MPKRRNPAAARSMKARTTRGRRRSPDRIRERTDRGDINNIDYNYQAYSKPDAGSLNAKARNPKDVASHKTRGGSDATPKRGVDSVPKRKMTSDALRNPKTQAKRRKISTESALRRADASMFNYDD